MPRPDPDKLPELVQSRAFEPPPPANIYEMAIDYVGQHGSWKKRIARVDAIVDNNWGTVWPDGTVTADEAKIADNITSDLEDLTALVSGPEPSVMVPAISDTDKDQRTAAKLRQVIATYRQINNRPRQRQRLAMDLIATGLACEVIWPDFSSGYPRFIRKNPRIVYPDPDCIDPDELSSLVVAYVQKARLLKKAYPSFNPADMFTSMERRDWESRDVNVYEYYDADWCLKVAATAAKGNRNYRCVVLAAVPNHTGQILASIALRTTPDGRIRGQFDKAIAPLGTANKMMELKLAQMADEIFATKIVRGIFDNPDDYGPGGTLYTTDYQAGISREETARSSADFYNDINMLIGASREASGVPPARHGTVEQNIISAQGINALQGKYVTLVSTYQGWIADLERRSNSKALAVDQMYLDYEKPMSGVLGGASFTGLYVPSLDIAGRFDNRVTYGAASGLDAYNRNLMLVQQQQYSIVSQRYVREQQPDLPDPVAMEADIAREAVVAGILARYQDPQASDEQTQLRFASLVAQGKTVLEAADILGKEVAEQQAAASAQQQALGEIAAPTQEEAAGLPYLEPLAALRGA